LKKEKGSTTRKSNLSGLIKSYDKLVSILDYLKDHPHEKLQTIAGALDLSKSTLHRIVKELVEYRLLMRDDRNLTYKLGTRLLEYSSVAIEGFDIRRDASDIISELNQETKETVHLATLVDGRIVYVDKRESLHTIRMYSLIGKEAPFHCTGVGKAIMAFQPPTAVRKLLAVHTPKRFTDNTLTSDEELEAEFSRIRENGFAVDREEHENGIICIAAPVRDHTKNVVASISITSITQRMTYEQLFALKEKLLSAADAVSRNMGYSLEDRR